ncbi:MAG: bifunctional 4-hydroxy-2-oxoglutarate aldolase/2-dehydro-3-deoxy-phosphogluconate aldolase [Pirellulales bacterium]|nr:bifunctional 4-hydroxy-2-oxoglutarate aldolase/2-dehydro-3-deoxy-phosphogluconate aldolase [Pirellulales bacterium]
MCGNPALARVLDTGIVAILRAPDGGRLADVAEALRSGGVEVIEVTFTVPRAHRVLEQVADRLGDRILLGAGSVLDAETARIAMLSGAEFLVSPTVSLDVIQMGRRYAKPVMAGAMTPTEVLAAWEAGSAVVKVFPSEVTGPAHIKAIHGPLPQIPLMPTGGVNLDTAAAFLRAGACALGVGGALASAKAIAEGDLAQIESTARRFVEVVAQARRDMLAKG